MITSDTDTGDDMDDDRFWTNDRDIFSEAEWREFRRQIFLGLAACMVVIAAAVAVRGSDHVGWFCAYLTFALVSLMCAGKGNA